PAPWTERESGETAAAVDDEARRQRAHAVGVGEPHRGIEANREREALLVEELRDHPGVGVDGHCEHHQIAFPAPLKEPLHRGHLLPARWTPRCPEVDEHDLSAMLTQLERAAVCFPEREVVDELLP